MSEYITIQGKQVPFTRQAVAVSDCELDPSNPRIQYLVGQKAGLVSDNELDALIWDKDAVKALANSILQNGAVYESLFVQRAKNGKFRVREGHCRTVACRPLLEQYPHDTRFLTMPAMIFDVELTEEDLAVLLADMHVASKIRWDAYEQAKHVSDLFNIYGKTYDWLSNHLRLSNSKIKELLWAYQATTDYLNLFPGQNNIRKFSFFHEVMKKKEIREQFQNSLQFKQRFHRWLEEGRITDSKQIRSLPLILFTPMALKALDEKGMEEAVKVLMQEDPSLESDLFAAVKNATEKLRLAPASDIQDLKAGHAQKTIMLRNLSRAIEDLATLAGVKL
jgi:hypothetical protein